MILSKRKLWAAIGLLAALVGSAAAQQAVPPCKQCPEWNLAQAPFRIFGNTYYVGPHGLTSILITSPAGHVLIDGALPQSVDQIASNIQSLGFRIQNVKIILNSHVHFDHAGGIAELQRRSGARVMASEWSAGVMKKGGVGRGDPQFGALRPLASVKNVHIVRDGESLKVGDVVVTAHLTPGHTPGGTTWTWKSCESTVCRDMVYADSLTPVSAEGFRFTRSPHALENFETSFRFFETTPCDILLTAHPDASSLWDRLDARGRGVTPDPMVNSGACRELAQRSRDSLKQRLAQESSKDSTNKN